ncbi:MAG TPA: glycerol kinase, partial [Prolixibacteraceae bacterium]|nr:glycerol kinase [Prolixibacteraceae bacterium]
NNLLMQFQADVLGAPVYRPVVMETTALGAAYLAGLATGFWKNIDEIKQQWSVDRCFTREMEAEKVQKLLKRWGKALSRAMSWEEDE